MTESRKTTRATWRVPRTAALIAIAVLVLLAGIALSVLDPNRYRGRLEELIGDRLDAEVTLGRIEYDLWPQTEIRLQHALVDHGDWTAELRGLRARGALGPLLRRRISLRTVEAESVVIHIPEDPRDWLDVPQDIRDAFRPRSERPNRKRRVSAGIIDEIAVARVAAHQPGRDAAIVDADIRITDVLSDNIQIEMAGSFPALGPKSVLTGSVNLERARGTEIDSISGDARLHALRLNDFDSRLPDVTANLTMAANEQDPQDLVVDLAGEVDGTNHSGLDGSVRGVFRYTPDDVGMDHFEYAANDAALRGNGARGADGALRLAVEEFSIRGGALAGILEPFSDRIVHLETGMDAAVHVFDVAMTVPPGSQAEFSSGEFDIEGLVLADTEGNRIQSELSASGVFAGPQVQIERLRSNNADLSGTVVPELDLGGVRVGLTGTVQCEADLFPSSIRPAWLKRLATRAELANASALVKYDGRVQNLSGNVTLQPGVAEFTVANRTERFQTSAGSLALENDQVRFDVAGAGESIGDLSVDGSYAIQESRFDAAVTADIPRVVDFWFADEDSVLPEDWVAQHGRAPVQLAVTLPDGAGTPIEIQADKVQPPEVRARLALAKSDGGWVLGRLEAETGIEGEDLPAQWTGPFDVTGPAGVELKMTRAAGQFQVAVDGSQADAALTRRIRKRPGDPLQVLVAGSVDDQGWDPQTIDVWCLGVPVTIEIVDGGLVGRAPLQDIAALSPLLPDGGYFRGEASFEFDTTRDYTRAQFAHVAFRTEQDTGLDELDGELRYERGNVLTDRLYMRNEAGDCTFVMYLEEDTVRGSIKGNYLDINVLQRIVDTVRAATGNPADASADSPRTVGPLMESELAIELAGMKVRDAELGRVTGWFHSTKRRAALEDLEVNGYGGTLRGRAHMTFGEDAVFSTTMEAQEVDIKLLDDLYFGGERGFRGISVGRVQFRAPMGSIESMFDNGSGSATWISREGSFGQLGWATKLLSVLRTSEILTLRAPVFGESGLVFDECSGVLKLTDGLMKFEGVKLESTAYRMDALGYMDFAHDATDIDVNVFPLNAISKMTSRIPIIRDITEQTTGRVGVRIDVTGPPDNLEFSVPPDGVLKNVFGIGRDPEAEHPRDPAELNDEQERNGAER